jgi:hypothetical protein
MPAPLFKRWAPPKPATQQQSPPPASLPIPSRDAASTKALSPEAPPANKDKKAKKRRSEATAPVAESPEVQSHADESMDEGADAETPASHKKPMKRKRDARAVGEDGEDVSKKHKAILSKFEKASKLAEARGQLEDGDETDGQQQPEEELHGKHAQRPPLEMHVVLTEYRPSAYASARARSRARIRSYLLDPPYMACPAHYRRSLQDDAIRRARHSAVLCEEA